MFDRTLVDVEDFLTALGIGNVKRNGREVVFSCPFPAHAFGDSHPSASMNIDNRLFNCFGCHESGDVVDFLARLEGVSHMQAVRWLRERYDTPEDGGSAQQMLDRILQPKQQERVVANSELPKKVKGVVPIDWHLVKATVDLRPDEVHASLKYPLQRGFTPETLETFGWGYDRITDRVTFLIRDEGGRVVGMKGRSYDQRHPKYIAIGDTPKTAGMRGFMPFAAGQVVFNMDLAKTPGIAQPMVLVEGELNAMMVRQVHRTEVGREPPIIGLPGSHLTREQALIIRRYAGAVTLFFDSDDAGYGGIEECIELLEPFMPVKVVPPHEGDACSLTPDEVVKLISTAESSISLGRKRYV